MASLARTIFEEHLVRGELVPGQEIGISVDQTLVQDATGTMAMMQFEMFGKDRVQVDTAVVYDGSLNEWAADPDAPLVVTAA